MSNQISGLQDLLDLHYKPQKADHEAVRRTLMAAGYLRADDPILSTSTNYIIDVYGKAVFDWLSKSSTLWKLLPKKPWNFNGWAVITAVRAPRAAAAWMVARVTRVWPDPDPAISKSPGAIAGVMVSPTT